MKIKIRPFQTEDIKEAIAIWNDIVEEGIAFPQIESLDEKTGIEFFNSQSSANNSFSTVWKKQENWDLKSCNSMQ